MELAGIGEVNTDRYLEMMESSFRQVLSAFSIDFEQDVMGLPTDLNLEGLFWSKV